MRVLLSWEAKTNDYVYKENRKVGINKNGTHAELYKNGFDYDEHFILSTCASSEDKDGTHFVRLYSHLKTTYGKNTIPEFLGIKNVISIDELLKKLKPILVNHINDVVDIFISPGTASMQTAWYLLAYEFTNVNLFQVVPPKYRKGEYKRDYIKVNTDSFSHALAVVDAEEKETKKNGAIHKTETIKKQYKIAEAIANPYPVTTLILGETGTGKDVLANHIHNKSSRENKDMLAINCAALNDELLQSRLFGHVEGAFTGANKEVKGAFEEADGSTLFLDEIGDISKKLQQTLLRVLQEGKISKMGSYKTIEVDVRIIAATNKDLWKMVEDGDFRRDLYYRLAVADIETISFMELPPEEREEYITYFIEKWKRKLKRRRKITFSKEVKRCIDLHTFPGNFRELEKLIERFYVYAKDDGIVTIDMLPKRIRYTQGSSSSLRIIDIKNAHYRKVYKMFKGNKAKMYEALGITKSTWDKTIKELELN